MYIIFFLYKNIDYIGMSSNASRSGVNGNTRAIKKSETTYEIVVYDGGYWSIIIIILSFSEDVVLKTGRHHRNPRDWKRQ